MANSRHKMAMKMNKEAPQRAEPAILLTEDANMRAKARASGVSAISIITLKKLFCGPDWMAYGYEDEDFQVHALWHPHIR